MVETGEFQLNNSYANTKVEIKESELRKNVRPIQGVLSIGPHKFIISGTLGTVVFDNDESCTFTNQIICNRLTKSGALLLDKNNKALGLLFASTKNYAIANPIDIVLKKLNVHF